MKEVTKDVILKKKVVDTITVKQYETMDELLEHEPETLIVEYFNKQKVTKEMNTARSAKTPRGGGKKLMRQKAFNLCSQEELLACLNDYDQMQALIDSKLPFVKKQMEEEAAAEATPQEAA